MLITGGFINYTRWFKDKSAAVTIETQELPLPAKRELGELGGEYVYFVIKREPFTGDELKDVDKLMSKPPKSKSLKMRQMLYRLWESKGEGDFEGFYADRMDEFMQQISEML